MNRGKEVAKNLQMFIDEKDTKVIRFYNEGDIKNVDVAISQENSLKKTLVVSTVSLNHIDFHLKLKEKIFE